MNKLKKYIKGKKHILFFDLEGTQFSHECIAIGAVLTLIDKNGKIKKEKKPLKIYVKAKNQIGLYVENLTGIKEDTLIKEGVSFKDAMNALKKYVGAAYKSCLFVTFGNHDLTIINKSISYNLDAPKEFCRHIQKNYCDFYSVISEYVKDENNCPMSLVHYCELFSCLSEGPAHDPAVDAINLKNLYEAFIKNEELVFERYKKVMCNYSKLPIPILRVIQKLAKGETVDPTFFEDEIRKSLKND